MCTFLTQSSLRESPQIPLFSLLHTVIVQGVMHSILGYFRHFTVKRNQN